MEIRELRIGNYFEYRIQDELDDRKEWWELSIIDSSDLQILESRIDDDYRATPLTEEMHNKFGVYKNGFNNFEYELPIKNNFSIKIIFSGDYIFLRQSNSHNIHEDDVISVWNKDLTKRDMYINEFQNLYFALTGEELTFKNPLIFVKK